ncbi:hypothetical protein B5S31_g1025 [[Candida] boidinii]|nr:hypothetical protein B5S31_g1025 [[Candida] boidinii]
MTNKSSKPSSGTIERQDKNIHIESQNKKQLPQLPSHIRSPLELETDSGEDKDQLDGNSEKLKKLLFSKNKISDTFSPFPKKNVINTDNKVRLYDKTIKETLIGLRDSKLEQNGLTDPETNGRKKIQSMSDIQAARDYENDDKRGDNSKYSQVKKYASELLKMENKEAQSEANSEEYIDEVVQFINENKRYDNFMEEVNRLLELEKSKEKKIAQDVKNNKKKKNKSVPSDKEDMKITKISNSNKKINKEPKSRKFTFEYGENGELLNSEDDVIKKRINEHIVKALESFKLDNYLEEDIAQAIAKSIQENEHIFQDGEGAEFEHEAEYEIERIEQEYVSEGYDDENEQLEDDNGVVNWTVRGDNGELIDKSDCFSEYPYLFEDFDKPTMRAIHEKIQEYENQVISLRISHLKEANNDPSISQEFRNRYWSEFVERLQKFRDNKTARHLMIQEQVLKELEEKKHSENGTSDQSGDKADVDDLVVDNKFICTLRSEIAEHEASILRSLQEFLDTSNIKVSNPEQHQQQQQQQQEKVERLQSQQVSRSHEQHQHDDSHAYQQQRQRQQQQQQQHYQQKQRERQRQRQIHESQRRSRGDPTSNWTCEFCEYEQVYGVKPVYLIKWFDRKMEEQQERENLKRQRFRKVRNKRVPPSYSNTVEE